MDRAQDSDEYEALALILDKCNGLAVEVLAAYVQHRIHGDSPSDAAAYALYDWDC